MDLNLKSDFTTRGYFPYPMSQPSSWLTATATADVGLSLAMLLPGQGCQALS